LVLHIRYYLGYDIEVSRLLSDVYKFHRVSLCECQIWICAPFVFCSNCLP